MTRDREGEELKGKHVGWRDLVWLCGFYLQDVGPRFLHDMRQTE